MSSVACSSMSRTPFGCVPERLWRAIGWIAVLAVAAIPFVAHADDELPGRVGRIAEFAGQLFLAAQESPTQWEAVGINYPITSGDNLWVAGAGRAEVDYGGGQFRLAADTSVHVSRLDDSQFALFITQGRMIVRVRIADPGDATRIDTPNTQVTLTRPGLYRIEVAPDRPTTTVTVREGEALIALANGAQQTLPGQTVSVTGTGSGNADIRNGAGIDGFDTWSANRDRRYERGRSTPYVSRQMVGYAELDEHGSWETYPEYGAVWFPTNEAAGWVPYRDGYWTSVGAWGPTWVDNAPWGYAPFHYGRWARIGSRWGWCPGSYVARPTWAPALVGWFGGPGWGPAFAGAPAYGWVPLGWREPYFPSWRGCGLACWAHHNRPHGVNVAERPKAPPARYANAAVPGALSAVTGSAFIGGKTVGANTLLLPASLASLTPVLSAAPELKRGTVQGPTVRAGLGGAPMPASSLYPVNRSPRGGSGFVASPTTASPATNAGEAQPFTQQLSQPSGGGLGSVPREGLRPPRVDVKVPLPERPPRAVPNPAPPSASLSGYGGLSTVQRAASVPLPAPHLPYPSREAVVPPLAGGSPAPVASPAVPNPAQSHGENHAKPTPGGLSSIRPGAGTQTTANPPGVQAQ